MVTDSVTTIYEIRTSQSNCFLREIRQREKHLYRDMNDYQPVVCYIAESRDEIRVYLGTLKKTGVNLKRPSLF